VTLLHRDPEHLAAEFRHDGYLTLPGFLPSRTVEAMRSAFDALEMQGRIRVGDLVPVDVFDIVYLHDAFAEVLGDAFLLSLLAALLGPGLELYDSKFINKPRHDAGLSTFDWHQDFAGYPHTNFDLVTVGIHIDDEHEDSGPLRVLPGSHRLGPLSHADDQGHYLHRLTSIPDETETRAISLTNAAGFVTVHHCLTIHSSDQKKSRGNRRVAYYQVRADDNVQLAGHRRRSAGYRIGPQREPSPRYARFPDGSQVELRGESGRIIDHTCDPQKV
jgi:phytanoyl-CoA hydroxylase